MQQLGCQLAYLASAFRAGRLFTDVVQSDQQKNSASIPVDDDDDRHTWPRDADFFYASYFFIFHILNVF